MSTTYFLQEVRGRLSDLAPHLGRLDAVELPMWLNGQYFKVSAFACTTIAERDPYRSTHRLTAIQVLTSS